MFYKIITVDQKVISAFSTWAFPAVLSFLMMIMYNDVKEMKTDIKALLEQSAGDKVKIDYLQREIEGLKSKLAYSQDSNDQRDKDHEEDLPEMYAVLPNSKEYDLYNRPSYPSRV